MLIRRIWNKGFGPRGFQFRVQSRFSERQGCFHGLALRLLRLWMIRRRINNFCERSLIWLSQLQKHHAKHELWPGISLRDFALYRFQGFNADLAPGTGCAILATNVESQHPLHIYIYIPYDPCNPYITLHNLLLPVVSILFSIIPILPPYNPYYNPYVFPSFHLIFHVLFPFDSPLLILI